LQPPRPCRILPPSPGRDALTPPAALRSKWLDPRLGPWLGLTLLATAVLAALVESKAGWIVGPAFWKWGVRDLPGWRVYPVLLLAALPFALAQWGCEFRRWRHRWGVPLLMLAVLSLELAALGLGKQPWSLERLPEFIRRPLYTSYFKDADTLQGTGVRPWLASYPERMAGFRVHSRNKPPGPILFFAAVKRLAGDDQRAAWLGGLLIAALATLVVPATYGLIRGLARDREAAWAGASLIALSPGLLLFLPCLDQVYPILTALLVLAWHSALERGTTAAGAAAAAAGFGLALALALFVTYNLLVLGLFLGLLTLDWLRRDPRGRLPGALVRVAAALGTLAAAYGVLWLATGFDPVGAFRAALANQAALAEIWQRPWPRTIPWDLADFLLGVGWLPGLLAGFLLLRPRDRPPGESSDARRLVLFVVLQLVGVAATGLLRTETARVWLFLQPLLALAAALELRGWSPGRRQAVYFCLWLLTATICRNLRFL
jgi:hypothetical protein